VLFLRPYSLTRLTTRGQHPNPADVEAGKNVPGEKVQEISDADASQLPVAPAPGDDEEKQAINATKAEDNRTESINGADAATLTNVDHEKR
jgi:hypothetical protein